MAGETDLHELAGRALAEIGSAADLASLDAVRSRWLGRGDGLLTLQRKSIGSIEGVEARRQFGATVNALVARVEERLEERRAELRRAEEERLRQAEAIDLTRPPPRLRRGRPHPVTLAASAIRRIFAQLGYRVVDGPEIEYDRYNFELVRMYAGDPSRDTQATFYVDGTRLLRTHTSPVQIRAMRRYGAPLRAIVPGRTFRRDYDATHMPMFHQVEGICIDEGVALSDLKGTLLYFARSMFGSQREIRLRPHHFQFTEPSIEVDVGCMTCGGSGCRSCRHSGWIEMLGAGMMHPEVLANGGIDPDRYRGFAFGMGIDRIAQLLYGVDDGRLFFDNDVRLLRPRYDSPR